MKYKKPDAKKRAEILSLALCGLSLNGYSKSFRGLLYDKTQDDRIALMKEILMEAKAMDPEGYNQMKKDLKELVEVL